RKYSESSPFFCQLPITTHMCVVTSH
ncbi:unnamed protein product, partial [Allacma fusca]